MCVCRQDEFAATGVSGELYATVDKALDERTIGHNPERLCLLKGGIVYSNAVTTVSPGYANETLNGGERCVDFSRRARPGALRVQHLPRCCRLPLTPTFPGCAPADPRRRGLAEELAGCACCGSQVQGRAQRHR